MDIARLIIDGPHHTHVALLIDEEEWCGVPPLLSSYDMLSYLPYVKQNVNLLPIPFRAAFLAMVLATQPGRKVLQYGGSPIEGPRANISCFVFILAFAFFAPPPHTRPAHFTFWHIAHLDKMTTTQGVYEYVYVDM